MKLNEAIDAISEFSEKVKKYRELLQLAFNDRLPRTKENTELITQLKTQLNSTYGRLEKYIKGLGNNPKMNDGVWNVLYSPYHNGFSEDIPSRVLPSLNCVLQDLEYILGKLTSISDKDFDTMFQYRKSMPIETKLDYWHFTHPGWLLWNLFRFVWRNKIFSSLTVLLGLIAIDYSVAWKNLRWIKNYIIGLLK